MNLLKMLLISCLFTIVGCSNALSQNPQPPLTIGTDKYGNFCFSRFNGGEKLPIGNQGQSIAVGDLITVGNCEYVAMQSSQNIYIFLHSPTCRYCQERLENTISKVISSYLHPSITNYYSMACTNIVTINVTNHVTMLEKP